LIHSKQDLFVHIQRSSTTNLNAAKMYTTTLILYALATLSIASPLIPAVSRRAVEVQMTFIGGPASYTMTFPSDGEVFLTSTFPLTPLLN